MMRASTKHRDARMKLNCPVERLGYSIGEALATGCFPNRNALYRAIAAGEVSTWKVGKRRMVSAASLRDYVARKAAA
jgi:hypothetical protein